MYSKSTAPQPMLQKAITTKTQTPKLIELKIKNEKIKRKNDEKKQRNIYAYCRVLLNEFHVRK